MTEPALHTSRLHSLSLLSRGKVRDNYAVGNDRILMLASDRISAFDVIMGETIPGKGRLLTRMALWWFRQLEGIVPNHLTGDAPEGVVADDEIPQVAGRAMLVRRLRPIPIEAVVRGYLAGSGWAEYQHSGRVCGVPLPDGLPRSARLIQPIYTPAAKAEVGQHDENITYERSVQLCGERVARQVRDIAMALYEKAAAIALAKGLIIADTKFEFGLDDAGNVILMDEVLTPDSSRYWPANEWREGANPPSFDKQYLRDWLEEVRVDGQPWSKQPPAPTLPAEVIANTAARYRQAYELLTGQALE